MHNMVYTHRLVQLQYAAHGFIQVLYVKQCWHYNYMHGKNVGIWESHSQEIFAFRRIFRTDISGRVKV